MLRGKNMGPGQGVLEEFDLRYEHGGYLLSQRTVPIINEVKLN